jgi:2-oxo-4-hydroxy-4-carboxy-5-ureidoimidazoline decarboxylase
MRRVASARPNRPRGRGATTPSQTARSFTPDEVGRGLGAHPRIGERVSGTCIEADFSRQEQSGVARDAETVRALAEVNRAYEARFGRVFLICATGSPSRAIGSCSSEHEAARSADPEPYGARVMEIAVVV